MIPPKASSAPRPIVGILWMIFTGFNFVAVTVLVRQLGTDLPAAQSAFLRFAIGALFFAPSLLGLVRGGLSPQSLRVFLARGAVHACAVVLWFYAMARIPVAEVTAIGYLNPVLVTLGATLFFKEKLTRTHYLAIGLAFVGTLIILRPGFRILGLGQMAQVGAAILFGCSYLLAKKLSQSQSAGQIVVMLSFCVTVGLAPLAFWVWVPPSLWQFFSLALVALFATLGHFSMTRA
ncbi:MAG: DMT family transporter, partial [Paracoccaceae bacterium]|nr:DMT family transporter [Paracoccaceae bacterium]MDP5352093.1 DMT family transporter [Paracoccaceae bacterium]